MRPKFGPISGRETLLRSMVGKAAGTAGALVTTVEGSGDLVVDPNLVSCLVGEDHIPKGKEVNIGIAGTKSARDPGCFKRPPSLHSPGPGQGITN